MRALKPGGRRDRLALLAHKLVDSAIERRVRADLGQPLLGHGLKDSPGILGQLPKFGVQLTPQFVARMMPAPAQVQSQFHQRIVLRIVSHVPPRRNSCMTVATRLCQQYRASSLRQSYKHVDIRTIRDDATLEEPDAEAPRSSMLGSIQEHVQFLLLAFSSLIFIVDPIATIPDVSWC